MKILITGGTNGMGKGLGKVLAKLDNQTHEIIILCRSERLGEATIREFENTSFNKKLSIILCDLSKLEDVKNAIIEIQAKHEFLDGIFINAGLGYASCRVETKDEMDSHFQVNYLSQFMLTLNLLNLLEKSKEGGRVIFNVTKGGEIFWDDMQMKNKWSFEAAIHQAMVAKRMFLIKLHNLYRNKEGSNLSFIGFQIPKTVWSNQLNIIPLPMKIMATIVKIFGGFISIEKCGELLAPLFTEPQEKSLKKSGKFISLKDTIFVDIEETENTLDHEQQDKLWEMSLELCKDEKTLQISKELHKQQYRI